MGEREMEFYSLCSFTEPPHKLFRKHNGSFYHCQLVLPLPEHLVIFGVGNWTLSMEENSFSAEVSVSADIKPQRIGTLSSAVRCLVWQGDWRSDLRVAASEQAERGGQATLCLILNGQLKKMDFSSSTPVLPDKTVPVLDDPLINFLDDTYPLFPSFLEAPHWNSAQLQPESSRKFNPEPSRLSVPACSPLKSTDTSNTQTDQLDEEDWTGCDSNVKRLRACPSPRWDHTLCLSDPNTAILIGGKGRQKSYCKDGLWRLEIDGDNFWFPLETTSTMTIPVPQSVCGHSATYDPDTKRIYIFGGMNDEECFNKVYILDTLTWKWSFVVGKGKVPSLAYHSAVVFQQELFIFGGLLCWPELRAQMCSNTLYIFNPEHEIWYQPIVVGERPLPRYGHSGTLLGDKLILFGGSQNRVFLNDLHVLDLGFMEYVNVQIEGSPTPRCRHAAVPLCGNKILISGGHNLSGALQDLYIFNIDTYSWSSLSHHTLCSVPRAGHSLVHLDSAFCSRGSCHTLLVFGGSDSTGRFYSDTLRVTVELGED